MSLILDALNRAERERQKSQPLPDIHTRHPLPQIQPEPSTKPTRSLTMILVLLVALIIIAVVFWWLKQQPQFVNQPAPVIQTQSAPIAQQPEITQTEKSVEPQQPVQKSRVSSAQIKETAAPAPEKTPAIKAPVLPAADLEALYAEAQSEPEILPEPASQLPVAPQSQPQLQPLAETTGALTYASLTELPDVGDLPWSLRQEIPTINYSAHNYRGDGQANVVINGQMYRPGQALASELTLESVYEDGVILKFRQTAFKLRALNSWINM